MAGPKRRYPKEAFVLRGDAIYEKDIKPLLEPKDRGKYVAIDIETGDYEISSNRLTAGDKLRSRIPDAQIYMKRAGFRYLASFGGGDPEEEL